MNLDFGGAAFRMFSVGLFVIKSSHNFVKKNIYIYIEVSTGHHHKYISRLFLPVLK